jgi:hypothetical protein
MLTKHERFQRSNIETRTVLGGFSQSQDNLSKSQKSPLHLGRLHPNEQLQGTP